MGKETTEGCGCILFVVAVFLAVVLWQVTPELVAFLETWFRAHS